MPHDKNEKCLDRGDRVLLTAFIRDVFPPIPGTGELECNITVVIEHPLGGYQPIVTLNSKSLELVEKNAVKRWMDLSRAEEVLDAKP